MKKKLLMGLASVFVLAACGNGATEESDTIKLGGNFELSGGASAYGTLMDEGIKMAVAEQNAADGLLGKEIEYISYDNKSEPSEST